MDRSMCRRCGCSSGLCPPRSLLLGGRVARAVSCPRPALFVVPGQAPGSGRCNCSHPTPQTHWAH
eukprot:7388655-Alexandrium_andersonii.AAC.1